MQNETKKPRRRKIWKFEQFAVASNCFEFVDFTNEIYKEFSGNSLVTLEIGAGTADFSLQLARKYPDRRFIAIDIKADRLYAGARAALAEKLDNICFVRAPLDKLSEFIPKHSVETLWITFPDPFPRARSAKHRLTHPRFLSVYAVVLAKLGKIHFKTDNHELFCWSLEQFAGQNWHMDAISFDLHESSLPEDTKLLTVYERRFIEENFKIHYLSANTLPLTQ